jgi:hypothetical protein
MSTQFAACNNAISNNNKTNMILLNQHLPNVNSIEFIRAKPTGSSDLEIYSGKTHWLFRLGDLFGQNPLAAVTGSSDLFTNYFRDHFQKEPYGPNSTFDPTIQYSD